jgi:single-stranded DNA-binding protein
VPRHEHPRAFVSGNITSTPQLTHTGDGTRVVNLSLAENTRRLVDGKWVDGTTTYWEVVCFGRRPRTSPPCGARAIAIGTFRTRTRRGDDDGERSRLEIVANLGALSEHAPRACAVGPPTRCSAAR